MDNPSIIRQYCRFKSALTLIDIKHLLTSQTFNYFNQQTFNLFNILDYLSKTQSNFVFIISSYNNSEYVEKNLESIFTQNYPYYRIIYIDDNSPDKTYQCVQRYIEKYQYNNKIKLIKNPKQSYAGYSRFIAYHQCYDDEIIVMVDGDDWLSNPNVLSYLNHIYQTTQCLVSYGCYQQFVNGKLQNYVYSQNEYFPLSILQYKSFRKYRWVSQHLRTGYAGLFKRINLSYLLFNKQFPNCCTDLLEMFPVLEMASPNIVNSNRVLYIYNIDASKKNNNSYFNQSKNLRHQRYRDNLLNYISNISEIYDDICLTDIMMSRTLKIDIKNSYGYQIFGIFKHNINFTNRLLYLLDMCQITYLGVKLDIKPVSYLITNLITIGYLNKFTPEKDYICIDKKVCRGSLVLSIDNIDFNNTMFSNYYT